MPGPGYAVTRQRGCRRLLAATQFPHGKLACLAEYSLIGMLCPSKV
jgi:hypothetical protein